MKVSSAGVLFSISYEIAVVRPLRQTTLRERENALKAAYYNTELVPQEMVYVDLKTDSGVSSLSTAQLSKLTGVGPLESGMEMAPEGNRAFVLLSEKFREIFGFPYVVPVAQGRAAERIWAKLHVKEGTVVAGNIGSSSYMSYTLVGDTVNVAARLCQRARAGEMLFSRSVKQSLDAIGLDVGATPLPPMQVRGRTGSIDIFCVPVAERVQVTEVPVAI